MIALVAQGIDENVAASPFVSVPVPLGTKDGDLAIVGVGVPAGVTVSAPDGWTQVVQTDPTKFGIAVFYRTVLNAPLRWVFPLSSSALVAATIVVYRGVDQFVGVEAYVAQVASSGSNHLGYGPYATSLDDEEVALFAAAPGGTTMPFNAGFVKVAEHLYGTLDVAVAHRSYAAAVAVPLSTITYGSAVGGATVAVVLRPSVGRVSVDDVRRRILGSLPAGVENTYDLTPGGDYFGFFQAIAEALKAYAFDLVDVLREERLPSRTLYKLGDWLRVFGLSTTRTATVGTVPQRQARVQAAWRAAAGQGSSIPEVQSVVGPILGYVPSTAPQVIECSRAALDAVNSYGPSSSVSCPPGTTTVTLFVRDGGAASKAGARLKLAFSSAGLAGFSVKLTAPAGGVSKTWVNDGWSTATVYLYGADFAGGPVWGRWRLDIVNPGPGTVTLSAGSCLFVDGIARGQDTGGAIFHWGVYADPVHLGENGTPADVDGADDAIRRMRQAHTVGGVILSTAPYPDTTSGPNAAIPDRCVPT